MTTACLIDIAVPRHYRLRFKHEALCRILVLKLMKSRSATGVAYRLSTGVPAPGVEGKVIGIIKTQDGKTLADVEWDKLGSPRRLDIANLIRTETAALAE